MKLIFDNVRFRNFLSFGSKWQEIEFQKGVNIILGFNGSGKSSCMETVPFALFGKTHRDVKKADLVNWKNRKQLEVQLSFFKGDDNYKVLRAIKPNNFEIYKNDMLFDKLSHVKDYQSLLEDIIGTNFQTFMSLIHSNINSSKPILGMSKPDKRKFIEKVFGLTIYSKLIDKCNKKIASIDTKIKEAEFTIGHNEKSIRESIEWTKDINRKLTNLKSSTIELNDTEEELNDALSKISEDVRYFELMESIDDIAVKMDELEIVESRFRTKKAIIGTRIKDILKRIPEKIEYETPKMDYRVSYELINEKIEQVQKEVRKYDRKISTLKGELEGLKKRQKQLDIGKCPTCGQDVDKKLIKSLDTYASSIETYITNTTKIYEEKDKELGILTSNGIKLLEKAEELKSIKDKENKRKLLTFEKNKWKRVFIKLLNYMKKMETKRISLNNKSSIITEEYEKENKLRKNVGSLKSKVELLKERVSLEETTRKELKALISTDNNKSKEHKEENKKLGIAIRKFNDIKDYMEHIKFVCKDENIKAFAISSMVPALTRNTNKYLSDIGHPFYAVMDSWLNLTIKGPGITSGSYNSLSSGEKRSVDLSLQNAFLDIARVQSGVYADVLILDELLDSSLDSSSLDTLLQMVNNKQREDDSKVFIISHRDEISDIEIANKLMLEKKGGYSQICLTT